MPGIIDYMVHSTVRIVCEDTNGEKSLGTGFMFGFFKNPGKYIPAIVTNKHVIEGASTGQFNLTLLDADCNPKIGEYKIIKIENFESKCIKHPDPNIDVAIFLIGDILCKAKQQDEELFFSGLEVMCPTNQTISSIEEIIMIGYPNSLWDEKHNLPLIRKGITSTHPNIDFNGKPEFLIDAACFPGSSGSPVFLANFNWRRKERGNMIISPRIIFIGILYAGPQYTVKGEIITVPIPTSEKPIVLSNMPLHLGIVIRWEKLNDFYPIIKEQKYEKHEWRPDWLP
jgi:hypothetical protein